MKKLYWSKVRETIFYKGKTYEYTHYTHMIYADDVSTSTKTIEDFEEFSALHNLRSIAEEKGKITICMDDFCDRTLKKAYFEKVIVTTYIFPIPDCYDFSRIMKELNYKDFIEFVKDNGLTIGRK